MALPKKQRLKSKNDFERILKSGRFLKGNFYWLRFTENDLSYCRGAAIAPANYFPKAVTRNKIKRTLLNSLAEIFPNCKQSVDVIVGAKPGILNKRAEEVAKSLFEIFKKANIV